MVATDDERHAVQAALLQAQKELPPTGLHLPWRNGGSRDAGGEPEVACDAGDSRLTGVAQWVCLDRGGIRWFRIGDLRYCGVVQLRVIHFRGGG